MGGLSLNYVILCTQKMKGKCFKDSVWFFFIIGSFFLLSWRTMTTRKDLYDKLCNL